MIKRLIWTIWTPMSSVLKKADKLNLSLSWTSMGIKAWVNDCTHIKVCDVISYPCPNSGGSWALKLGIDE